MAHAMRAILLASATAATLIGRRSIRRASHSRFVPCWRAYRMTAMAPATSSQRKCRLPCFEMLPSLSLPPVECCLGTKPIHAARLRPDENVFQSPTSATSAVATIGPTPGISSSRRLSSLERCQVDTLLDGHDLCPDSRILASKDGEAEPRGRWNAIILLVSDHLEQLCRAIATLRRDNAELGHVPTDGVRQHRSLTNQKLPATMQHQAGLLLCRLRRHKPHRRTRDRFADCGSVVGIVFAALQIGFYIARRQQPHRVAERLKPAAPIMCARTCLNADEAGWQAREELQQLRSGDALADYYRATGVHSVNLKNRLRDIETDRANLAHGRLPSKWCDSTQPPCGTSMPQSGRRPQHQNRSSGDVRSMSALHLRADLHPVQPLAAIAAIRRTGITEYWMGTAVSVRFDAHELHHLAPFLGFVGDELSKIGGRADKWCAAEVSQPRPDFGIAETRVDCLVELVNNLRWCVLGRTDAEPGARLVARHKFAHGRDVRQCVRARRGGYCKSAQSASFDILN